MKNKLLRLLKKEALRKGKIVLSSGKSSSFYIDGRAVTLSAKGAYLAGELIFEILKEIKAKAAGGPTLGADPIAGALAAISYIKKNPIRAFIIRKAPKSHGTRRQIEGPYLEEGLRLVLIDDVATSGESFLESIDILRGEGYVVDTAICIVDRGEGAREALAQKGCRLISIFNPKELGVDS